MRWTAFLLLLVNLGVAGYLMFIDRTPGARADLNVLELNADRVKSLKPPAGIPPAASAGACLAWGNFTSAELDRALDEVGRLKPARFAARDLDVSPVWWVHVPPFKTREEAERRLREIEEAGNKDARLITEGERWRNAVSLGVFKSEDAANAYLARMKELKVRNAAVVRRTDLIKLAAIYIADPAPAFVTRVMALRSGFEGTDVKAGVCPAGLN